MELGKVKQYYSCSRVYIFEIIAGFVIGAGMLAYSVRSIILQGFVLADLIGVGIGVLLIGFAAYYAVVSLRCKVFVYENGIRFVMPKGIFTMKEQTLAYGEIIAATLRREPTRGRTLQLVIQAVSGDYILKYLSPGDLQELFALLQNKARSR